MLSSVKQRSPQATTRSVSREAERERALFARYRDGDATAREQLVELMLPLVKRIARGYADRSEPLDDIIQVGNVGLLLAIDRFDPERGVRFAAFATPTISGEIKRYFRDRGWAIRVPRDTQELTLAVRKKRDAFSSEHGREPSVSELAGVLERTEEEVLDAILASRAYQPDSIQAPRNDGEDELGDTLGTIEPGFARAEDRALISKAAAGLPLRDRKVLALYFVSDLTQRQIAAEIGVSQMQVSRILGRAVDQLKSAAVR